LFQWGDVGARFPAVAEPRHTPRHTTYRVVLGHFWGQWYNL
jgi:hypothetical protein